MRIGDLPGVWRRSLIAWSDGTRDDTTRVIWLQGKTYYGDLRQPIPRPSCSGVKALRHLDRTQIEALAHQEGFAGTLVQHRDHFEWTRTIDYQPPGVRADRGTLERRDGMMVEAGYEVPYVEHWHRDRRGKAAASAVVLQDAESGCLGMMICDGDVFMFARARKDAFAEPGRLLDRVHAASSLEQAQDLVDCEVSLGSVGADWVIERSTLPFRESACLAPYRAGALLVTSDVTPDGTSYRRTWTILAKEGSFPPL